MARGNFSQGVRIALMKRAGGRCARPACGRETLGPSKNDSSKGQSIGVAAHIKAAGRGGPRFDENQTEEERHSVENGIWLCSLCAGLIDKNGGADFSVGELLRWKLASERAALERLQRTSAAVLENCVQSLIYINVPRLRHYVALSEPDRRIPMDFVDGVPGDGYIAQELYELERAVGQLRFPALDWQETIDAVDDPSGLCVSFEAQFWTKNGPRGRDDKAARDLSNLKTAPHVYTKAKGKKLVLPYDPRFVTTTTAVVELSRGRVQLGGFALIKLVEDETIVASPFLMGLASTPAAREFWEAMARSQKR